MWQNTLLCICRLLIPTQMHLSGIFLQILNIRTPRKCIFGIQYEGQKKQVNYMIDVHGFSPYQLVFGRNPTLPNTLIDRPPALESTIQSNIIRENLNALHAARQAFIASESSEKIRRALRRNVRSSGDVKYVTGDACQREPILWFCYSMISFLTLALEKATSFYMRTTV